MWEKTAEGSKEKMKDMSMEKFLKDPSFCHTALLPAEIRYKGFLTENFEETGGPWDQVYEKATMHSKVISVEKDGIGFPNPKVGHETDMLLNSADAEWEVCNEDLIHVDHKDFFYISSVEGWRSMTIPNEASKKYYTEYDAQKSNGWVYVCPSRCDWGKCKSGDARDQFMNGTMTTADYGSIEFEVNGVKVTDTACMRECCLLLHDDPTDAGKMKWTPTANGQYEIKVQISNAQTYAYFRVSSFILL